MQRQKLSRWRPVARNRTATGCDGGALVGRARRSADVAARSVARRVGQPAVECARRNYCRAVAPGRARTGGYLVFLAVHRPPSSSLDSTRSAAAARVRLADRFFRDHRGLAFFADGNLALLAELHLQPGKPWPVD